MTNEKCYGLYNADRHNQAHRPSHVYMSSLYQKVEMKPVDCSISDHPKHINSIYLITTNRDDQQVNILLHTFILTSNIRHHICPRLSTQIIPRILGFSEIMKEKLNDLIPLSLFQYIATPIYHIIDFTKPPKDMQHFYGKLS